jgi:hypothetical protein
VILLPKTYNYDAITFTRENGVAIRHEVPGTFVGNCQPTTGRDIDPMLVGRHMTGLIKAYSMTKLNVSEEGTNHPGDTIHFEGAHWEVIAQLPNSGNILGPGTVYKYLAARR